LVVKTEWLHSFSGTDKTLLQSFLHQRLPASRNRSLTHSIHHHVKNPEHFQQWRTDRKAGSNKRC
jgi:hypothetical protein